LANRAVHVKCGNLSEQDPYFVCGDHIGAKKEMAEHRNKSERLRDQNKAVSDDLNEQVIFTINKKFRFIILGLLGKICQARLESQNNRQGVFSRAI
jgi:hypothetical protein